MLVDGARAYVRLVRLDSMRQHGASCAKSMRSFIRSRTNEYRNIGCRSIEPDWQHRLRGHPRHNAMGPDGSSTNSLRVW